MQPQMHGMERAHAARLDALEFVDDQHERLGIPCAGALRRPKQRRELAAAAPFGGGAGVPAVLSRQRALDRGGANAAGNHSRIQLGNFPELFLGAQCRADDHEQTDVEGKQLRFDQQRPRVAVPAGVDFGGESLGELRLADTRYARYQRDAALRVAVFSNQVESAQHRRQFASPASEVRGGPRSVARARSRRRSASTVGAHVPPPACRPAVSSVPVDVLAHPVMHLHPAQLRVR